MLIGCLIGLIAVLLFRYACFDTEEYEFPSANHGSIISFIESKHKTPNLPRSYCLCTTRMVTVKFLFNALCVWPQFGFQVISSSTFLPNPTATSQAHVNNLSNIFPHDFSIVSIKTVGI